MIQRLIKLAERALEARVSYAEKRFLTFLLHPDQTQIANLGSLEFDHMTLTQTLSHGPFHSENTLAF
jgi:hypothetical protein